MAVVDQEADLGGEPAGGNSADQPTQPASFAERVPPALVLKWAFAGTLGVLLMLLIAYGVYLVRSILVLVLVALFVAISLEPAVHWMTQRRVRRPYAVTIVVFGFLGLLMVFIWSIAPALVEQGGRLIANLPGYLETLSEESKTIREITDRYHLTDRMSTLVFGLPSTLAGGAVGFFQKFLGILASTLTVLVLSIYFMADMPRLRRSAVNLFPPRRRERVTEIIDVAVDKVGGYMIGNIIISLCAGVATFVCLELVGVPFALPLAVTVAVTDLIPMVGATLGAVICLAVSVLTVDIWPETVIVLLFFIAYQQLENYVIAPRVLRNTVDLSSVAVLLAALIGGAVLGLVGAIMAIPVAATIKVISSRSIAAMHPPRPRAGSDAVDTGDESDANKAPERSTTTHR